MWAVPSGRVRSGGSTYLAACGVVALHTYKHTTKKHESLGGVREALLNTCVPVRIPLKCAEAQSQFSWKFKHIIQGSVCEALTPPSCLAQ